MTTIRPDMITAYCLDRIAAFTPLAVMLAFLLSVAGCAVFRQPLVWCPGPVEIVPGVGVRGVSELGTGIRLAEVEKAGPNGNCNGYVFPAYEGMEAHTGPTGAVTVVTLRHVRDDALMPESAVPAPRWPFIGRICGVAKDLDSLRVDDIIAAFGRLPRVDDAFYWKDLLGSCGIPARVTGPHFLPDSEILWYPKIGLYVTCRRGSGRVMEVTAVNPEEISGGVSLDGSIPLSLFSSGSDAGVGFSGPDFWDGNLHLFTIINDTGRAVQLKRAVSVSPECLCECAAIRLEPGEETYMGLKLYKCTSTDITLPLKGSFEESGWFTLAVKITMKNEK